MKILNQHLQVQMQLEIAQKHLPGTVFCLLVFPERFVYLFIFERQAYRECRDRHLESTGSLPDSCNSLRWAGPKPGIWGLFLISHVGEGPKDLGQPPLLSQAHYEAAESKVGHMRLKPTPIWVIGTTREGFTKCDMMLAPPDFL